MYFILLTVQLARWVLNVSCFLGKESFLSERRICFQNTFMFRREMIIKTPISSVTVSFVAECDG